MKNEMPLDEIICPQCENNVNAFEEPENLVSYWGEYNIQEIQCGHCGHAFKVKEHVERNYSYVK